MANLAYLGAIIGLTPGWQPQRVRPLLTHLLNGDQAIRKARLRFGAMTI